MKLPSVDRALVEPGKVRDYLLSPTHPVGRFKAAFFAALGYTQENWAELQRDLLQIATEDTAVQGRFSRFGNKVRGSCYANRAIRTSGIGIDSVDRSARRRSSSIRNRIAGRFVVKYSALETVVLERDLPEYGLRRGDLGAVVEVYDPDGLEVEFVRASGKTQALVELTTRDVRAIRDEDLVAVRSLGRTA